MPFRSKAQMRFMYSQHPEIAKEFADKTSDFKSLPEHVKKKKQIRKGLLKSNATKKIGLLNK